MSRSTTTPTAASRRQLTLLPSKPRIGNWQLVRLLGRGEWTEVYQARPVSHATPESADYAVKVLREGCANASVARELLRQEARVAGEVRHPHLVSVLGAQLQNSPPFLVMPYAIGTTLREALTYVRRLSAPHALWLMRQTAEALAELHRHGWLHGDVKPENVFVAESGHVTLLDLGFARPFGPHTERRPEFAGSPAYLAPELLIDATRATAASDVYSLGVTLFELLTGVRPFPESDSEHLSVAHLMKPPPDPRRMIPSLSRRLARLLRQMLAKDPLRRPGVDELLPRFCELEIEAFDERAAAPPQDDDACHPTFAA